uniref:ABC transporter domain-containing protein n=1 Tax=Tanacetum cinerariifolium TaxID=118510 RepID=A0A699GFS3_TANCI|nr:hypothetical protein [Tanacetum cinerariifolium]
MRTAALEVIVVQVDLAEAHARRPLGHVQKVIVVERDRQVAVVGGARIRRADQIVFLVQRETVVRDGHVVGTVLDVERAVVTLLEAAVRGGQLVVGLRRVGERVMVDPHVFGVEHGDAVVLRVPVARVAVVRIPDRRDVARVDDIEVADDDVLDAVQHQVGVDQPGVGADADQRGVAGELDLQPCGLVGGVLERPAAVAGGRVDGAVELDDFRLVALGLDGRHQLRGRADLVDRCGRGGRAAGGAAVLRGPSAGRGGLQGGVARRRRRGRCRGWRRGRGRSWRRAGVRRRGWRRGRARRRGCTGRTDGAFLGRAGVRVGTEGGGAAGHIAGQRLDRPLVLDAIRYLARAAAHLAHLAIVGALGIAARPVGCRREAGRLRMGDHGALEDGRVRQFQAVDVGAAQVGALEPGLLQRGVAQAAAFEHGVAEIAARQVGVGKVEVFQGCLPERKAAQVGAHQQAFLELQAQVGHFLERRSGQLAAAIGDGRQLGAAPLGVVEVAAVEAGVDQVGRFEVGAAGAAALPDGARQLAGKQRGAREGAALEGATLQVQARQVGVVEAAVLKMMKSLREKMFEFGAVQRQAGHHGGSMPALDAQQALAGLPTGLLIFDSALFYPGRPGRSIAARPAAHHADGRARPAGAGRPAVRTGPLAAPRPSRLGLPGSVFRSGHDRRDCRLVCRGGAVSPPAGHTVMAHGHHPQQQGPHRQEPGEIRRKSLHYRGRHQPAAARGRHCRQGGPLPAGSGQRGAPHAMDRAGSGKTAALARPRSDPPPGARDRHPRAGPHRPGPPGRRLHRRPDRRRPAAVPGGPGAGPAGRLPGQRGQPRIDRQHGAKRRQHGKLGARIRARQGHAAHYPLHHPQRGRAARVPRPPRARQTGRLDRQQCAAAQGRSPVAGGHPALPARCAGQRQGAAHARRIVGGAARASAGRPAQRQPRRAGRGPQAGRARRAHADGQPRHARRSQPPAGSGQRPALHPHQRHRGGRAGRAADPCHRAGGLAWAAPGLHCGRGGMAAGCAGRCRGRPRPPAPAHAGQRRHADRGGAVGADGAGTVAQRLHVYAHGSDANAARRQPLPRRLRADRQYGAGVAAARAGHAGRAQAGGHYRLVRGARRHRGAAAPAVRAAAFPVHPLRHPAAGAVVVRPGRARDRHHRQRPVPDQVDRAAAAVRRRIQPGLARRGAAGAAGAVHQRLACGNAGADGAKPPGRPGLYARSAQRAPPATADGRVAGGAKSAAHDVLENQCRPPVPARGARAPGDEPGRGTRRHRHRAAARRGPRRQPAVPARAAAVAPAVAGAVAHRSGGRAPPAQRGRLYAGRGRHPAAGRTPLRHHPVHVRRPPGAAADRVRHPGTDAPDRHCGAGGHPTATMVGDYANGGGDWGAMNWHDAALDAALARLRSPSRAASATSPSTPSSAATAFPRSGGIHDGAAEHRAALVAHAGPAPAAGGAGVPAGGHAVLFHDPLAAGRHGVPHCRRPLWLRHGRCRRCRRGADGTGPEPPRVGRAGRLVGAAVAAGPGRVAGDGAAGAAGNRRATGADLAPVLLGGAAVGAAGACSRRAGRPAARRLVRPRHAGRVHPAARHAAVRPGAGPGAGVFGGAQRPAGRRPPGPGQRGAARAHAGAGTGRRVLARGARRHGGRARQRLLRFRADQGPVAAAGAGAPRRAQRGRAGGGLCGGAAGVPGGRRGAGGNHLCLARHRPRAGARDLRTRCAHDPGHGAGAGMAVRATRAAHAAHAAHAARPGCAAGSAAPPPLARSAHRRRCAAGRRCHVCAARSRIDRHRPGAPDPVALPGGAELGAAAGARPPGPQHAGAPGRRVAPVAVDGAAERRERRRPRHRARFAGRVARRLAGTRADRVRRRHPRPARAVAGAAAGRLCARPVLAVVRRHFAGAVGGVFSRGARGGRHPAGGTAGGGVAPAGFRAAVHRAPAPAARTAATAADADALRLRRCGAGHGGAGFHRRGPATAHAGAGRDDDRTAAVLQRSAMADRRAHPGALVRAIDLHIPAGGTLTLLGESGSGKSLLAQAIMGNLPAALTCAGAVEVGEHRSDAADVRARRALWGRQLALLPQEPWLALDPTMRAARQIAEVHELVRGMAPEAAAPTASAELARLGMDGAGDKYPFQLSGGMAQRVAFLATHAAGAPVMIIDEPTKGLDADRRADVLAVLRAAIADGLTLLTITHDVWLARQLRGQVAVMLDGEIVEQGEAATQRSAGAPRRGGQAFRRPPAVCGRRRRDPARRIDCRHGAQRRGQDDVRQYRAGIAAAGPRCRGAGRWPGAHRVPEDLPGPRGGIRADRHAAPLAAGRGGAARTGMGRAGRPACAPAAAAHAARPAAVAGVGRRIAAGGAGPRAAAASRPDLRGRTDVAARPGDPAGNPGAAGGACPRVRLRGALGDARRRHFGPDGGPDGGTASAYNTARRHHENLRQTSVRPGRHPPPAGTRPRGAGQLRAQRPHQHHDYGLAHDDRLYAGAGRLLHRSLQSQLRHGRTIERMLRPDRPGGRGSGRAADCRVLRQLRMPAGRCRSQSEPAAVRVGSGARARGRHAQAAQNPALPGRRPVHGLGARDRQPAALPRPDPSSHSGSRHEFHPLVHPDRIADAGPRPGHHQHFAFAVHVGHRLSRRGHRAGPLGAQPVPLRSVPGVGPARTADRDRHPGVAVFGGAQDARAVPPPALGRAPAPGVDLDDLHGDDGVGVCLLRARPAGGRGDPAGRHPGAHRPGAGHRRPDPPRGRQRPPALYPDLRSGHERRQRRAVRVPRPGHPGPRRDGGPALALAAGGRLLGRLGRHRHRRRGRRPYRAPVVEPARGQAAPRHPRRPGGTGTDRGGVRRGHAGPRVGLPGRVLCRRGAAPDRVDDGRRAGRRTGHARIGHQQIESGARQRRPRSADDGQQRVAGVQGAPGAPVRADAGADPGRHDLAAVHDVECAVDGAVPVLHRPAGGRVPGTGRQPHQHPPARDDRVVRHPRHRLHLLPGVCHRGGAGAGPGHAADQHHAVRDHAVDRRAWPQRQAPDGGRLAQIRASSGCSSAICDVANRAASHLRLC